MTSAPVGDQSYSSFCFCFHLFIYFVLKWSGDCCRLIFWSETSLARLGMQASNNKQRTPNSEYLAISHSPKWILSCTTSNMWDRWCARNTHRVAYAAFSALKIDFLMCFQKSPMGSIGKCSVCIFARIWIVIQSSVTLIHGTGPSNSMVAVVACDIVAVLGTLRLERYFKAKFAHLLVVCLCRCRRSPTRASAFYAPRESNCGANTICAEAVAR